MESDAYARRQVLRTAVVIVGAGILAWSNSFSVPFLYDDIRNIAENARALGLDPESEAPFPSAEAGHSSRPVAQWTFIANYALGGPDFRGYHAVNLLIHILAGLALFGVVRRTLASKSMGDRFGPHATPLALVAALLWLVHPLQTESVTYVVHRYESLMGLFFLLMLYCAVRGIESDGRGWLAASVLFCALGMGTKERMVVAPVMVLLYDRAFVSGTFREALRQRRFFYLGLAATWAVLAVIVLRATSVPGGLGFGVTPLEYARIQIPAVVHYLRLVVWPQPLVLDS